MSRSMALANMNARKMEYLALGMVMLLGAILRFYQLEAIPVGLNGDEGADGLGGKRILRGEELPLFITEDFGEEPMHTYLVALSFALWGVRLWAIRFVSAFVGIITIPVIFWLAKELLQQDGRSMTLVPILSSFFLSASYWHIIYSRAGLEVVTLPLFSSALFYFLWRGIRTDSRWTFIISGLILGASLYSYRGARFLPILLSIFFGGWVIISQDFRCRHLVHLVLAALVAVVVCAPLGVYALAHPDIFFAREMHVSIFNAEWGRGSPLQAFGYAVIRTLGMFNFQGDPQFDRNPGRRPVLDPISSLCFLVGLAVALWRWKRPHWLFIVVWFVVMTLPGAFTAEALPHFHRGIGALPPLCLLCAVGVSWVKQRLESGITWSGARATSWAVLCLILVSSTALSYRDYFLPWQRQLNEGQIIGRSFIEAAEVMNATRIPDGVWILPASSLRPRNLPYYEVSFLYDGPEPEYTLNMDEGTAPAKLAEITQGHQRAAVINWKEYVLEEAYLSMNSDPKGLLDFLFRKYGRHIRTEVHETFDLVVYELPASTDFSIARSFQAFDASFGDELRLVGIALGGSSFNPTSTPEEVEKRVLPSGKEGWMVLQWQSIKAPSKNYKVAMYLLDGRGRLVGQADKLLLSSYLQPTSGWTAAQMEMDYYTLPSLPATPPGEYDIQVVVYDAETLERLTALDEQAGVTKTSVEVGTLQLVKPPEPPQPEPMAQVPEAERKIAPGIQLLGYDLPRSDVSPGETVSVALYWQALEDVSQDYVLSLSLQDGEGQVWLEQQGRPVDDTYPTTQWEKGEVLRDWHDLHLPPDTPPGDYALLLQVLEEGETIGQAGLGLVEVRGRPHVFDIPEIQHPLEARLGDGVLFLGYDLNSSEVTPGDTLRLTLYWQALEEMQVSYAVFTHLLDAEERIWGQMDNMPLRGKAPTTSWLPGEVLADEYDLVVDQDAPVGTYTIEIGMYEASTGQRLSVYDTQRASLGARILLERIRVLTSE